MENVVLLEAALFPNRVKIYNSLYLQRDIELETANFLALKITFLRYEFTIVLCALTSHDINFYKDLKFSVTTKVICSNKTFRNQMTTI